MASPHLKFNEVSFGYDSSAEQLFKNISFHITRGWTGVVGANGSGKTTLLKLATGHLIAEQGDTEYPRQLIYCQQRTDDPPDNIRKFLQANDKAAHILKAQLRINPDWGIRWDTLSHGERKRMQLAQALWLKPDLLAIDEPTNHLDAYARELISDALSGFEGVGLLVSHDRKLLDRLCRACIFSVPPSVIIRPGGITRASAAFRQEQQAVQKQHTQKKKELKKLKQEINRRKQKAEQADHKRSKRHLAKKDHDARSKTDMARVTGKDGHAGRLYSQLQGRFCQQTRELSTIKVEKTHTLGIWMPGSVSKQDTLLHLSARTVFMGKEKQVSFPDLYISPTDRIAITGPNGSGKSTLIRHLLEHLNVSPERITYIPQETDIRKSKNILKNIQTMPKDQRGHIMTIISRLNSRPERLLSSVEPSPGEIRNCSWHPGYPGNPIL